ncbi:MAG: OmpA family protein, partial [bacterium]|nr:OmpA family protein [bacterium]
QRRVEAELAAARSAAQSAEAESARAQAILQEEAARSEAMRARSAAEMAEQLRGEAEREKAELRARLLRQFNQALETRDTDRGLVVNMSDVLFDTAKFTLRPIAREKLARLGGIVLAYPELRLQAEGHTDTTGSEEFNQELSEKRAASVRDFLVEQGVPADAVAAVGLGFSVPVADNGTREGRQKNRRVELIVSGEVIGTSVLDATIEQ